MKTFVSTVFLFVTVVASVASGDDGTVAPSSALQDKCSAAIGKLGDCLGFASGKADVPSSTCCSTVADTRQKEPVCLCFIIQMAHAGGASVDNLGLQMDKLVQLPAACKLANTDISNCPKLLNLSPSSPDAAIFSNSTKATTSSTTTATTTPTSTTTGSSTTKSVSNAATLNYVHFLGTFASAAMFAIVLLFF